MGLHAGETAEPEEENEGEGDTPHAHQCWEENHVHPTETLSFELHCADVALGTYARRLPAGNQMVFFLFPANHLSGPSYADHPRRGEDCSVDLGEYYCARVVVAKYEQFQAWAWE